MFDVVIFIDEGVDAVAETDDSFALKLRGGNTIFELITPFSDLDKVSVECDVSKHVRVALVSLKKVGFILEGKFEIFLKLVLFHQDVVTILLTYPLGKLRKTLSSLDEKERVF